jgi:rod shape-determining protein MreD
MIVSRTAAALAAVITVLLIQATVIGPLTFPVPVSLPALFVIVVGIYAGPGTGVGLGFATGLMADLGSDQPAGVQALCWLGAGLVAGILGGLVSRQGYRRRSVAGLAALLGAATSVAVTFALAVLDTHGASVWLAVRDVVPVGLVDALLSLLLIPVVAAMLRAQGIRAPRSRPEFIGLPYA